MKKILVTGAGGNVGFEVIRYLFEIEGDFELIAAVRNIEHAKKSLLQFPNLKYVHFDFVNPATFDEALQNIDSIFLLRPPHISDVAKYFAPLIAKIKSRGITEIVFLSVQGADKSKIIPHARIEDLIINSGVDFIFLRPGYFMQNLTTTLLHDIINKQKIILPAGHAKFNWIDVCNIGEAAALLIARFPEYKNQALDITGYENENFDTVCNYLSQVLPKPIQYDNANPIRFYFAKKKEGMKQGMILVMIMLHFLPRFQKESAISNIYEQLSGKKPARLLAFIKREKGKLQG